MTQPLLALQDIAVAYGKAPAVEGVSLRVDPGSIVSVIGPNGAGKSTLLNAVMGILPPDSGLLRRPPLQAPHHTATVASLVGGGAGFARPGVISLADHGVVFLDEAPEFSPGALEALRQPLESGEVVIYRAFGSVRFPAHFQLVLAANPCPCGRRAFECECAPQVVRRYRQRLSGPLLDRVDVR